MAAMRSSGHKEPTLDHLGAASAGITIEGNDPQAHLDSRVLSYDSVARAVLLSKEDYTAVGTSKPALKIDTEEGRKLYDGLLTTQRAQDPTSVSGPPPTNVYIESKKCNVVTSNEDYILAEGDGKVYALGQSAHHILVVEGTEGAKTDALTTIVSNFQQAQAV